jgi:hypothetical protein
LKEINVDQLKYYLARHIVTENVPFAYIVTQSFLELINVLNAKKTLKKCNKGINWPFTRLLFGVGVIGRTAATCPNSLGVTFRDSLV